MTDTNLPIKESTKIRQRMSTAVAYRFLTQRNVLFGLLVNQNGQNTFTQTWLFK